MVIWFAILIPLIGAGALYWIFHHKVMLWEAGLMVGVPMMLIAAAKGCSESMQATDEEFLGGYVQTAEYFEDWDERVSCRHPIACSHPTYSTDSKGRRYRSGSKHFNDGHYHAYDVDFHRERWVVNPTIGSSVSISQTDFERLAQQFGNREFVDLNRKFHSNDGDKYVSRWKGEPDRIEPVTVRSSYENRVQASESVFNFKEVDPKTYGLYDYPNIGGYAQPVILGGGTSVAERKFQFINSTLGPTKQVHVFVLIFKNQPTQAAMEQEAYWKRGNKNELVTCVGVDKDLAVQWAHVFSWSESDDLKVEARNFVMGMKNLDLEAYADWLAPAIEAKWVRKKFAEFSYLTVEPTTSAVVWTFILTFLLTVGLGVFAVVNDADPDRKNFSFKSFFTGRRLV